MKVRVPSTARTRERTPWLLGVLCFLIPALPNYVVVPGPLKGNGSPARAIAVLLFALVVVGFVLVRRTTPTRLASPGAIVMVAYFLLLLLLYGVGLQHWLFGDPVAAAKRTRAALTLVANVGVALYVLATVRTMRQRTIVLGCLTAGLSFACVVGYLQSWSTIDLRYLFRPPGFVINAEESSLGLAERGGVLRVVGTSQHAIEFSVLAAVTVPLTLYFARHASTRGLRLLSAAACCVAALAVPAAVSRTGIISAVTVLLIMMFAFTVRQLAIALVGGALAVVGYTVAFPHNAAALWETMTSLTEDTSIRGRTADYAEVSRILHEHPIFGLGLGGEPTFYDNEWLQAIVQGGVVGVSAMILLTVGGIFGISAALRRAGSAREREQAYVMGAVFAGIMVSSTTFDMLHYQQATLILFIVFALMWSTFTVPIREEGNPSADGAARRPDAPLETDDGPKEVTSHDR